MAVSRGKPTRLALDLEAGVVRFRFRCPDAQGTWAWRSDEVVIPLPERLLARLRAGAALLAPTLREVVAAPVARARRPRSGARRFTRCTRCRPGATSRASWGSTGACTP